MNTNKLYQELKNRLSDLDAEKAAIQRLLTITNGNSVQVDEPQQIIHKKTTKSKCSSGEMAGWLLKTLKDKPRSRGDLYALASVTGPKALRDMSNHYKNARIATAVWHSVNRKHWMREGKNNLLHLTAAGQREARWGKHAQAPR